MIALESQHVVRFLRDDLGRQAFLGVESIGGDDAACDLEQLQQLWHGGNLVALALDFARSKHQARIAGPGADQRNGAPARCGIGGVLNYFDAVSVHPYRQAPPETAAPDYARLRALIEKYAPAGKEIPIVCGEWGYTSQLRERSETVQARFLTRQWLLNIALGARLSMWYDWRDDGLNPDERENRFGLVRHPYRAGQTSVFDPKPAYFAAQTLTRQLRGLYFRRRLSGRDDSDWITEFGRGDNTVLAAWTIAPEITKPGATAQRFYALPPGHWRATSYAGESLPAVQTQVELSGSPLFLERAPSS